MTDTSQISTDLLDWLTASSVQEIVAGKPAMDLDLLKELRVRLIGPKYDATLTPPVMQSVLALQEAVNRTYRTWQDTRQLSWDLKREIGIRTTVRKGSSDLLLDFAQAALRLNDANPWFVILALAVPSCGKLGITWVKEHYATKRAQITVARENATNEQHRQQIELLYHTLQTTADGLREFGRLLSHSNAPVIEINGNGVTPDDLHIPKLQEE